MTSDLRFSRYSQRPSSRDGFKIAIICALPIESSAVRAVLDEEWELHEYGKLPNDFNSYTVGRVGYYNVVLVHLPAMGGIPSASATANFRMSYPRIELAFLVGVCGGTPIGQDGNNLFLGDIIIGDSVVQYGYGRRYPNRLSRKNTLQDSLPRPTAEVRGFLHKMKTIQDRMDLAKETNQLLNKILQHDAGLVQWKRPPPETDVLFSPTFRHKHRPPSNCIECSNCLGDKDKVCEGALNASCNDLGCADIRTKGLNNVIRTAKMDEAASAAVHFGTFACADEVMKSALDRDRIAKEENAIGFEMEGAGSWDNFPTIVVKSVCDYADSHKTKNWQRYAALTASCCMKTILAKWTPSDSLVNTPIVPSQVSVEANKSASKDRRSHSMPRNESLEQKTARENLLSALRFREMTKREEEVDEAHKKTFEWIFNEEDETCHSWFPFVKWLRANDGNMVYWMRGKAGSGKSTLMSFVITDSRTHRALKNWSRGIDLAVVTHFFWSFGSDLQNSIVGLLRSIIYQLLDAIPKLWSVASQELKSSAALLHFDGDDSQKELRVKSLKRALYALLSLDVYVRGKICLFLDGLDECLFGDRLEGHSGVQYQLLLTLRQIASFKEVKLCVSSRPLVEFITAYEDGPLLKLEDLTKGDLTQYARSQLQENFLIEHFIQENTSFIEKLVRTVVAKAEGIFLWLKIVVDDLALGILYRQNRETLLSNLDEIPSGDPGIENLYKYMLKRLNSQNVDKLEIAIAFQLLFAVHDIETSQGPKILLKDIAIAKHIAFSEPLLQWPSANGSLKLIRDAEIRLIYLGAGFVEIANATEIRFYHKTSMSFLSRPEIWTEITGPGVKKGFNAYEALLASNLLSFEKGGPAVDWLHLRLEYLSCKCRSLEAVKKSSSFSKWLEAINEITSSKPNEYSGTRKILKTVSQFSFGEELSSDFRLNVWRWYGKCNWIAMYLQEKVFYRRGFINILDYEAICSSYWRSSMGERIDLMNLGLITALEHLLIDCKASTECWNEFAKWAWTLIFDTMWKYMNAGIELEHQFRGAESPFITALKPLLQYEVPWNAYHFSSKLEFREFSQSCTSLNLFTSVHLPSALGYQEVFEAFKRSGARSERRLIQGTDEVSCGTAIFEPISMPDGTFKNRVIDDGGWYKDDTFPGNKSEELGGTL